MMSDLRFEVLVAKRESATKGIPPGKEDLAWVTNSATLLIGRREAILIDCFLGTQQTSDLADWVASHDRALTAVYFTHGHPDHFFGLQTLLDRFPSARPLAAPQVVAAMMRSSSKEAVAEIWGKRWPGLIPERLTTAGLLDAPVFEIEGHDLHVVDTDHTDTDATTALHVPSIDLIVAGDVVYADTHPFLIESDRPGRMQWLTAIEQLEALSPAAVVVGHGPMKPDHSPRHMAATRRYIEDFDRLDQETESATELYDRMLSLYPDRINPGSLWGSAQAAKRYQIRG